MTVIHLQRWSTILLAKNFQGGRDVLTFVPRWLIIQDTEFCQQGIENPIAQDVKCPNCGQEYAEV
jgi:hypothetical protein